MAHNKLYRNFIILQEDERGSSHSNDKTLSGYAKVEAKGDKCKVSFYAQNLRQEDNYSMVLICCKRDLKQLIDLGPLAINEVGKGDTSKEYYVNNIAGLGISYEKISGAAISRVKDNETEFIMHGFMNGEESADNWRKFKLVKVDSKRYINKLDAEPKKNDVFSSSVTKKVVISEPSNSEDKTIKSSTPESELVERKWDDDILQPKENIELESLKEKDSKVEEEEKNRIQDKLQNVVEVTDDLEEDRHKCKETNKCDKYEKHDKYDKCDKNEKLEKFEKYDKHDKYDKCDKDDKYDKHDKCDKDDKYDKYEKYDKCEKYDKHDKCDQCEDIEEAIKKLSKKLDNYDGIIDIKINHIHEHIIVYGFVKDKKDCNCKWKKFKLEKKCRYEDQDFNNIPSNSRRLEENFVLDKLTQMNNSGRMDIVDFDEYENDIQQTNLNNTTGQIDVETTVSQPIAEGTSQTSIGTMGEMGTGTTTGQLDLSYSEDTILEDSMTQQDLNVTGQTNMGQLDFSDIEELSKTNNMQQPKVSDVQQVTQVQDFKISGEVGQYFEKLAQDFQSYTGNLDDINFCKWYKINVKGIEDLSDESNYNQYTLAYYPMLNYYPYISKAGYFLLGYKCNKNGEMQYIVYGIPGSKEKNDQPYGGRTGFVTWTSDNKNGRGYWLMFYDFKNSTIVIPTK